MLYPREELARFIDGDPSRARAVWRQLCRIRPGSLRSAGRVYGSGMYKLEPKELASVSVASIARMLERVSA
jgi:adenine-specific DNA-methyltransferase